MDVYSEHIVAFKIQQYCDPNSRKKLPTSLYAASESAMMSFLFILNPCMEWSCEKSHCLVGKSCKKICIYLLLARSACSMGWWEKAFKFKRLKWKRANEICWCSCDVKIWVGVQFMCESDEVFGLEIHSKDTTKSYTIWWGSRLNVDDVTDQFVTHFKTIAKSF